MKTNSNNLVSNNPVTPRFSHTHGNPQIAKRVVVSLLALICALPIGCSAGSRQPVASFGALGEPPIQITELFVEGSQTDADGTVEIGGTTMMLHGSDQADLFSIIRAARTHGDYGTMYGALQLALLVSPTHELDNGWLMYAALLNDLPLGGAVALSEALGQDIERTEAEHHGISASSSPAMNAVAQRAIFELATSEELYTNAQGWIDDDEDMIERSRLHAYAASRLNRVMPASMLSWQAQRAIANTRGDLWESQATRVDDVFASDVAAWGNIIVRERRRADVTLNLYRSGYVPQRPNVTPMLD